MEAQKKTWHLLYRPEYLDEWGRLSSKFRNQIARKVRDLTSDPRPGGGRTALKGYDQLCRVRSGDYRIIYAYNDDVIQLLTVRRRNEQTYDHLDDLELEQLKAFQVGSMGAKKYNVADWEALAMKRSEPIAAPPELLPEAITPAMLEELGVPPGLRDILLRMKTVPELLDCQEIPADVVERVLERLCPRKKKAAAAEDPTPVVVLEDLVDATAAMAGGPIDAAEATQSVQQEAEVRRSEKKKAIKEKSGLPARIPIPGALVVVASRQQEPMTPYRGNTQRGIAKDTSYTVKLDGSVQLIYNVGNNERALLSTDEHRELVELVNEAKRRGGASQGGGRFVINEYRHVLVPTQSGKVLYAGVYTRDLEFEFEKNLISPVAPSNIRPGEVWPGPHVGVRYTLAAGSSDVRYEQETTRGTIKTICLTDYHSPTALARLLNKCRAVKPNGGALYVNEAREVFAPVDDGTGYKRRYIGHLGTHPWFPDPT